ncbi:iron ABC transporter permease [Corynebacterium sp. CCM 8835]|uniref:Iron ABC transporter permease n=1 Tax=Corynebacterium antarcticum TaxID=2800405 RepID=A0A9Q4CEL2_9CORY|nr:iron ABC transporter permease [Corynebacterium antarcticum]MCK7642447.1 iron ABC transporter permease [Corynebacterium antarcticum]MCK7660868.1 iron ABC transporter permease [Corynebacterium antarcticum]MCL0245615.1 iron ABC transporter permease [Corynebacterium antarcticum]MCX7491928.1 iron ABC transporter permease [Corynebacterium antarcticum]MCX7538024.1 iron ABC transporter permease [Corynebacterium antarcticum]
MNSSSTTHAPPARQVQPGSGRFVLVILLLIGVLTGSALVSLTVGSRVNAVGEALHRIPGALEYLLDPTIAAGDVDELTVLIGTYRLPRTILAVLCGAALGAAGAIIQGHTRNPLADPGILGINAGAAAAVVTVIGGGVATSASGYVYPAMAGCAAVTILIFLLSSGGPAAANPVTVILAGVAVSALLMAYVHLMVLSSDMVLDQMRLWATGSLAGRRMDVVTATAPVIVVGLVLALTQAPGLNLIALGTTTAASLGLPVTRVRVLGLATVAMLGGAATAAAGPLSFVGLAAPHMMRTLAGPDYRRIIPGAAVAGAILTLWADMAGRVMARPDEMAMGIVLALVGVPVFILLVRRRTVVGL